MARYVVTGGAGFIGSHVVDALLARGDDVVVIDSLVSGFRANLPDVSPRLRFIEADIRNAQALAEAMQGATGLVHLAAMVSVVDTIARPAEGFSVNVEGTFRVLEAAAEAGLTRGVFASSAAVYGDEAGIPNREEMALAPISPYGMHKATGELLCRDISQRSELKMVPLRFFNIFGPRQDPSGPYAAVISAFVSRLSRGEPIEIHGDGGQTRDFCYVANVVDAVLAALDRAPSVAPAPLNVGTGVAVTIRELARTIAEVLVAEDAPQFGKARPGDIRHSVAAIDRASSSLDYTPAFGLAEGLRAWLTTSAHAQPDLPSEES